MRCSQTQHHCTTRLTQVLINTDVVRAHLLMGSGADRSVAAVTTKGGIGSEVDTADVETAVAAVSAEATCSHFEHVVGEFVRRNGVVRLA